MLLCLCDHSYEVLVILSATNFIESCIMLDRGVEITFTCPKEQIMHKQLSLAFKVLIPNINFFENSMKPDMN